MKACTSMLAEISNARVPSTYYRFVVVRRCIFRAAVPHNSGMVSGAPGIIQYEVRIVRGLAVRTLAGILPWTLLRALMVSQQPWRTSTVCLWLARGMDVVNSFVIVETLGLRLFREWRCATARVVSRRGQRVVRHRTLTRVAAAYCMYAGERGEILSPHPLTFQIEQEKFDRCTGALVQALAMGHVQSIYCIHTVHRTTPASKRAVPPQQNRWKMKKNPPIESEVR